MESFEFEQFHRDLDDIRAQYVLMAKRCEILTQALEAADAWAVPATEIKDGRHRYIACDLISLIDTFVELASLLPDDPDFKHSQQPIRPLSLVEVGCGIGRNLNLIRAQQCLPVAKAVGFDIVPAYVDVARSLFGLGEDAFVQDAMDFDYGGFDIVFFYRPFSDHELQAAFEDHVIESAKTGAVIIGMLSDTLADSRRLQGIDSSGICFKKL